jgi:pimeloyl-ACP methyl ester carboxylesterase
VKTDGNLKLLFVAGLFAKSAINARFAETAKGFFRATEANVISIDLEGCKSEKQAVEYIRIQLENLGENVIIIGHSAGGQIATRFIGDPRVSMVVSVCGPSHHPLDYPTFLWLATTRYLWKTLSNKFFRLDDDTCCKLFGRTLPSSMRGDSWGNLASQMNFGWLAGNSEPALLKRGLSLFVATTGDKLITPKSVEMTSSELGGEFLLLDHPDHFPQVGLNSEKNINCILENINDVFQENFWRFHD